MKNVNAKKRFRWVFWGVFGFFSLLICFITLSSQYSPLQIKGWLEDMTWPLTIIRCGIYLLILGTWPYLMKLLAKHYQWSEEYLNHIIAQRYKIFIWLIILELLLAQNIIGKMV